MNLHDIFWHKCGFSGHQVQIFCVQQNTYLANGAFSLQTGCCEQNPHQVAGRCSREYFTAKDCQALRRTSAVVVAKFLLIDFRGGVGRRVGRKNCPENAKGAPEMQCIFMSVKSQDLIF